MKKYLSLILATIFMFTLVSCDFYYETELEAYYYDKIKEEYEFDYNKIFFENVVKEGVEKINNETNPEKKKELEQLYKEKMDMMILTEEEQINLIEIVSPYKYNLGVSLKLFYYLGEYSGTYVFIMDGGPNEAIGHGHRILGYEFDYGKSNFILATRGDKVYYLGDAYDAGLLEDDVIEDIYSKYLLVIDDIEDRYYS